MIDFVCHWLDQFVENDLLVIMTIVGILLIGLLFALI